MNKSHKILLVDDEEQFRFMSRMELESSGFEVIVAENGRTGLEMVRAQLPDLVLLDLDMPEMNGHEVAEIMKNSSDLRNIPVIILTSSDDIQDKLRRLEAGADDYVTKYADHRELIARINMVIRRNLQNLDSNPLTRLPGNNVIQDMIQQRIQAGTPFSVAYTDLDNFKAYNDKYGFKQGDEVILLTASVLKEAVETNGDGTEFIGHIGGDDFVVIATPDRIRIIADGVVQLLDSRIPGMYNDADRAAGYIETVDRQNVVRKFPLVSISIAVVTNLHRPLTNIGEIVRIVSELKKYAKSKDGSCVVVDKRTE